MHIHPGLRGAPPTAPSSAAACTSGSYPLTPRLHVDISLNAELLHFIGLCAYICHTADRVVVEGEGQGKERGENGGHRRSL